MGEESNTILGIISFMLTVLAIFQAYRYKKLADKIDKDKEMIIKCIQSEILYCSMLIRKMDSEIEKNPNKKISLKKDRMCISKTSKYKGNQTVEIIGKIKKETYDILKPQYIDLIAAFLNTEEETVTVTLKYEFKDPKELAKIEKINNSFKDDGLLFYLLL